MKRKEEFKRDNSLYGQFNKSACRDTLHFLKTEADRRTVSLPRLTIKIISVFNNCSQSSTERFFFFFEYNINIFLFDC